MTVKLHSSRISTRVVTSSEVSRPYFFQYLNCLTDNEVFHSPQCQCYLNQHLILQSDTRSPLRLSSGSTARRTSVLTSFALGLPLVLTWLPTDLHCPRCRPPLDKYATGEVECHGRGLQLLDRSESCRCEGAAFG